MFLNTDLSDIPLYTTEKEKPVCLSADDFEREEIMKLRKIIKKLTALSLCTVIVGSAAAMYTDCTPDSTVSVNAASYLKWGDFIYSVSDSNTASLVLYTGDEEFVCIPDMMNGHDVTTIGESCFCDKTGVISVTIPDTVKSIEQYAFAGCISLRSVVIPSSVTNIDNGAFGFANEEKIYLETVYGKSGSAAETFASNNKINFVESGDKVLPTSVKLSNTYLSLEKGQTETLYAVVYPNYSTDKNVTWVSTNSKIVSVTDKGVIKAASAGTAIITAETSNGMKADCKVVVTEKTVPIKEITIDKPSISIGKNESYVLKASYKPSNAEPKTVRWSSSDKSIVTVSGGKITGKKNGTAEITAWSPNGVKAVSKVTVKNAPDKFKLNMSVLSLGLGETYSLSAVLPDNTASALRVFRTSNSKIVKMTKTYWTGGFKAVGIGTAYVTAKLYNGKEASCRIDVKAAPSQVSVSKKTMVLSVGDKASLTSIIPSGSACASRTFRTSNSSVIKMTKTNWTGEFKAVGEGVAWVTVRTYNGKEASCKITVGNLADKIELYTKKRIMKPGQTMNIRYHVPAGQKAGVLTYSSGNPKVCTVNSSGTIKAVSYGTATVTVSMANGKKAACLITVTDDYNKLMTDGANRLPIYDDFPIVWQNPELPTGCELGGLVSVLRFYGFDPGKIELADNYLKKGPLYETDPWEAFVGDPKNSYSFGCYAPVIVDCANKYLAAHKSSLRARQLSGYSFEELFNFAETGTPVMVWGTYQLKQGYYTVSWTADNGKKITWYAGEHVMIILGRKGDQIIVGDPGYGAVKSYDMELFKKRYEEIYSQAVVIQ